MASNIKYFSKWELEPKDIDRAKSCTSESKALAQLNAITNIDKLFRRGLAFILYSNYANDASVWMNKAKELGANDSDISRFFNEVVNRKANELTESPSIQAKIVTELEPESVQKSITKFLGDEFTSKLVKYIDNYNVNYELVKKDIKEDIIKYLLKFESNHKELYLTIEVVNNLINSIPPKIRVTDESDAIFDSQEFEVGKFYDADYLGDWIGWLVDEFNKGDGSNVENFHFTELKKKHNLDLNANVVYFIRYNSCRSIQNGSLEFIGGYNEITNDSDVNQLIKDVYSHSKGYVSRMCSYYHGNPPGARRGEWHEIYTTDKYWMEKLKNEAYVYISSGDDSGHYPSPIANQVKMYPPGIHKGIPTEISGPNFKTWYEETVKTYPDINNNKFYCIKATWGKRDTSPVEYAMFVNYPLNSDYQEELKKISKKLEFEFPKYQFRVISFTLKDKYSLDWYLSHKFDFWKVDDFIAYCGT